MSLFFAKMQTISCTYDLFHTFEHSLHFWPTFRSSLGHEPYDVSSVCPSSETHVFRLNRMLRRRLAMVPLYRAMTSSI